LTRTIKPLSETRLLSPGHACCFSIAGLVIRFESRLRKNLKAELPVDFEDFSCPDDGPADVKVIIDARENIPPASDRILFDPGGHWRVYQERDGVRFEFCHPPSSAVYAAAAVDEGFRRYSVIFSEGAWNTFWNSNRTGAANRLLQIPHPLDQLFLVPRLAHEGGLLLHACGAVFDGKAFVFAGHSGDGKTTLARMLAAEGIELLSDERVAIRRQGNAFTAYGTPWPGEGKVVSNAAYPLGAVFVLRKADQHRVRPARTAGLLAELLARSIVPYYLARETDRILRLAHDLVEALPLAELDFSIQPGLLPVLLEVQRDSRSTAVA
jgi:hypothetical protein